MLDLMNVSPVAARLISMAVIHLVQSVARGAPGSYGAVAADVAQVAGTSAAELVPWEDLAGAIVRRLAAAGMPPPPSAVLDQLFPAETPR